MSNIIYDAILRRHEGSARPDVCIFYDEDKELVINKIADYDKKNGFSITEKDGRRYAITDIILRERKPTGEVISKMPYHKIFDTVTGKRIEVC